MQIALAAVAVSNPGCPLSVVEQTLAAFGWVTGSGRTETATIHMAPLFSLLAVSRM